MSDTALSSASHPSLPIPILTKLAHKILESIGGISKAEVSQEKVRRRKEEFFLLFPPPFGQYITYAVICFAALLFDFIMSSRTLDWLASIVNWPVEILAVLFTLMDGSVAIIASGAFAHNRIDKTMLRHRWRPVLWLLGGIKILMFIIFVHIVYADVSEYSWVETLLQVGFVILIYMGFDFAGKGLAYTVGAAWWAFLEHIWHKNPNEIKAEINKLLHKFDRLAQEFEIAPKDARSFYTLPPNY